MARLAALRRWMWTVCIGLLAFPAASLADDDQADQRKAVFAGLTLRGEYRESAAQTGLMAELEPTLHQVVARLERAAEDSKLTGVILRIDNPQLGLGKVHELGQAIARLRASGKTVYAFLGTALPTDYLIALQCDQVVMPESGTLILPGLRAEFVFFKGLLDKLGIQADLIQMGKYKGAGEPFTREGMTPELRQQWETVLADLYQTLVETIAQRRELPAERVKELLDEGMFSAADAQKAGLIDLVAYEDDLRQSLREKLQIDELEILAKYGQKEVDTDFSGFTGFMKFLELIAGGQSGSGGAGKPKIAVVYAVGPIVQTEESGGLFSSDAVTAPRIVAAIEKAENDEQVKAIVLRVDSPGGSALASDLIWKAVVEAEKPVVASMGDVAASGGYYIAMGADKILAEPGTITGSIGVIGGKMVVGGLYDKIGLTTEVIAHGRNSGLFSSSAPFTDSERQQWTKLMQETYRQFVAKAAQGRKLDPQKVDEELAQGRIWSGRLAASNGLVDELGTLHDAINQAKVLAGLEADDEVDLLELPKPRTFFEQLFGASSTEAAVQLAPAELRGPVRRAGVFRSLLREPVMLMLPYHVQVR